MVILPISHPKCWSFFSRKTHGFICWGNPAFVGNTLIDSAFVPTAPPSRGRSSRDGAPAPWSPQESWSFYISRLSVVFQCLLTNKQASQQTSQQTNKQANKQNNLRVEFFGAMTTSLSNSWGIRWLLGCPTSEACSSELLLAGFRTGRGPWKSRKISGKKW